MSRTDDREIQTIIAKHLLVTTKIKLLMVYYRNDKTERLFW